MLSDMGDSTILEHLLRSASPGGGWGYRPDQPAHLEPTCLAILALAADPARHATTLANAWTAVQTHAAPDGSYRLSRGRPQAAWPTALVLFAQAATSGAN